MANIGISGFSIEDSVNLTFDTGGAVPIPADPFPKVVSCIGTADTSGIGFGFIGHLEIMEE